MAKKKRKKEKVKVIKGKPFELSQDDINYIKDLQLWEEYSRKRNYLFTDKPKECTG